MKITFFLQHIDHQVELEPKPAYMLDQTKILVQQRKG